MFMTEEQAFQQYIREQEKLAPMVDKSNEISLMAMKAKGYDDIVKLRNAIKGYSEKWSKDEYRIKEMDSKFYKKLAELIKYYEGKFDEATAEINKVKSIPYDYSYEPKEYTQQAVQLRAMQLLAELPKNPNKNDSVSLNKISKAILTGGVIGSRAVLELSNIPAVSDVISVELRQRALEGSKSEPQKAFERLMTSEIRTLEKSQSDYFNEGSKLRRIKKGIDQKIKQENGPFKNTATAFNPFNQ